MTTGQRISDKRKEMGLSQEALGEKLGVSRQSIYKWESDASLPDVDKLIALSRLFSVSVGWLLGVEEDTPSPTSAQQESDDTDERQRQMMEEVLRRYQAAQPKVKKTGWEWIVRFLGFACVVLLVSIFTLNSQLDELNRKYNSLNVSINEVKNDTAYELDAMSDRVTQRLESVLKSQSDLAVDYICEVKDFDLNEATVTFSISIVPKTHVEGMRVYFQSNSNGEIAEVTAQQIASQTFAGELTCALTDSISISSVFQIGDTRQMQLLNQYDYLYTDSLPVYSLQDTGVHNGKYHPDGSFTLKEQYVYLDPSDDLKQYKTDLGLVHVSSFDVGLFLNHELVQWLEPCGRPTKFEGLGPHGKINWVDYFHDGFTYFHSPEITLPSIQEGDELFYAARITDEYGRVTMAPSQWRYTMRNGVFLTLNKLSALEYTAPNNYQFN